MYGSRQRVKSKLLPLVVTALCLLALLSACTEREAQFIDELSGGPSERARLARISAAMPANQVTLLKRFEEACATYDAQPNQIEQSRIFRDTTKIYTEAGSVLRDWAGTISTIATVQGGSTARIVIRMLDTIIVDDEVRLGTPVYVAAAKLKEGQDVLFSGNRLQDFNVTERGKVCRPNFSIRLKGLKPLTPAEEQTPPK